MKPSPERIDLTLYPRLIRMETRYSDMDPQSHLNNVAIATFYEHARVRMSTEMMSRFGGPPAGTRGVVASLAISYLHEGFYPGEVSVGCSVLEIGRTSYAVGQALFQNGRCIGIADTIAVYCDAAGPAPIPDEMRRSLEHFKFGASPQIEMRR